MRRGALFLLVLLLVQLFARNGGWLWVSVTEPHALILTQGRTVEYESTYFHGLLEGMLGWARPTVFTTAHYRFWLPELAAAGLLRWTGDAYWALAIAELVGAWLGGIGVMIAARALALDRRGAVVAGALFVLSPCVVAYMWRNQLQVQATGSIGLGLGASLALLLGDKPAWRTAVLLAGVWLTASLQYQFHVVVALVLVAVALSEAPRRRERLLICGAAAAGWGVLTLLMQALPLAAGYPTVPENNDPRALLGFFVSRVSVGGVPELGRALLAPFSVLARVYHPLMLLLAVVGCLLGGSRLRVVVLTSLVTTYGFLVIRDLDRVAYAAAPAIYLAAASALRLAPAAAREWWARSGPRGMPPMRAAVGAGLVLWLTALGVVVRTNADLWRDYSYVFASADGRAPR